MTVPFRWGILGPGSIAKQFAHGLSAVPDATLVAVGSRSLESAKAFAAEFKAPRAHESYAALAADPDIDAIYIATPHPMHRAAAAMCLEAGKAVLCEKPLTVSAREAAELVAIAKRKRVFLMEAMWTRFQPVMGRVREWLAQGAIGEPRMVSADFGFRCGWDPKSRLLDPALAGGALLDVGVYTVAFAAMAFGGTPKTVMAQAHLGESGVDEQTAVIGSWDGGRLALLSCAVRTNTPQEAWIHGTTGRIHIPGFWHAQEATLTRDGKPAETAKLPFTGNGYNYQAVEVARCVRAGLIESPIIPHDESVAIMKTMDEIRRQIGLRYPGEPGSPGEAAKSQKSV